MNYPELKKANPSLRLATETLFGNRLELDESDPRRVEFVLRSGGLTARMLVHHAASWRPNPCYQYYYWQSDKLQWQETHILFGESWLGQVPFGAKVL